MKSKKGKFHSLAFIIPVAAFSICLLISATGKKHKDENFPIPPGCVKIGDNLFYDEAEVGNVHYQEYIYWTKNIFGEHSPEYLATLPNTQVWRETDSCLFDYSTNYFGHRDFDFFPLVGITQQQAEMYAKWRADRVFERTLILTYQITADDKQNGQTYFSIDKYFSGKYQHIKKPDTTLYYPDYRLPTVKEWEFVRHIDDSVRRINNIVCNKQYIDVNPCGKNFVKPTRSIKATCENGKPLLFYDLIGNVGEWTSENGVSVGGSWRDKPEDVLKKDTFQIKGVNAYTGFRNVCQWKQHKFN